MVVRMCTAGLVDRVSAAGRCREGMNDVDDGVEIEQGGTRGGAAGVAHIISSCDWRLPRPTSQERSIEPDGGYAARGRASQSGIPLARQGWIEVGMEGEGRVKSQQDRGERR